ncbi:MAG TPA: hypothetical protein VFE62_16255 [Gemmataceae bacterium]|nr:hypothetical protein [Gemmataceae bacterium]
MDSYISYLSYAGSAVSMLTTLYFWHVRMRNERPSLSPHLVDKEFFLGMSRDGVRQIGIKAGFVVANHSVLPNAILGARLWVHETEAWQEVGNLGFDKQTPLPFNMPPLQTILLRLAGTLSFPYDDSLEQGSKTAANYLEAYLAQPLELRLELRHLTRSDSYVLALPTASDALGQATQPRLAA